MLNNDGRQFKKAKRDCKHYSMCDCKLLYKEKGFLNCELHNCSFYENTYDYDVRQALFNVKHPECKNATK
jgi:hypothetical protein